MKKLFIIIALCMAFSASAQRPAEKPLDKPVAKSSLVLYINPMNANDYNTISAYAEQQKNTRLVFSSIGVAAATSLATSVTGIIVNEVANLTVNMRKNRQTKWKNMIKNECFYSEEIKYINSITDFYSKGSQDGPLDPSNLNFNGFTIVAQNEGKDVMRFYCSLAIDEKGLDNIFNHSKFNLVVDSMFYYPYNCHLPNLGANGIFPENDKTYKRNTKFSFDERENLIVNMTFSFTSSWYNEAMMLARDVQLGTFNVQIPIRKEYLVDGVFVYRNGMEGVPPVVIAGDCFIVPRSYMPLAGDVAHWGTGDYRIDVTFSEKCNLSDDMNKHWSRDLRRMNKMKKENNTINYLVTVFNQNGGTVAKTVLESTSKEILKQEGIGTQGATNTNAGGGMPKMKQ